MKTTITVRRRNGGYVKGAAAVAGLALFALTACSPSSSDEDTQAGDSFTTREVTDGKTEFVVVTNPGDGPVLSYGKDSGVELLTEEIDGQEYAFKDMNGNGELDVWEDWREASQDRAADLAQHLSKEQIAGLMLFSSHERSPADGLTDAQKEYMAESRLRNVLNAGPNDVEANVTWSNQLQEYAEELATEDEPYVPVNFSSDPRSTAESGGNYNASGDISRWPSHLGLAATFDTETMTTFAEAVSAEYRALGIGTALSPQIDLATDPRWLRVDGTFGENVELASAMATAYVDGFQTTPGEDGWGADDMTVEDRHYAILKNGVDMFGGNNAVEPVLAAYDMWQADFEAGENDVDAQTRFEESGTRILNMLFQPGLYENAYLDLDESKDVVASEDKLDAGYQAQLDSVVMLKNDADTIAAAEAGDWADKTVYIPRNYDTGQAGLFGPGEYTEGPGLTVEIAEEYFAKVVTDEAVEDADGKVTSYTAPDLSDVDLVLVGMDSPSSGAVFANSGHDETTGEWYPLSLQYRPYTADGENVRKVSISGDLLADGTQENRSYFGNTSRTSNESDLDAFERAVAAVEASGKDIPVITVLKAKNPTVPAEFEAKSDAILVGFGVSDQALIETAIGLNEPQGRLPIGFPASMDAVEAQLEDVQEDTEPYVDSAGNSYLFGFGLNYAGPIEG